MIITTTTTTTTTINELLLDKMYRKTKSIGLYVIILLSMTYYFLV